MGRVPQDYAEASTWYAEAIKWYRKAAEQGNELGNMYKSGWGVPQNYAEE